MSSWKPKFKLAGKVFPILQKRPNMDSDREETSRVKANSLAGHDHSDIPRTPTGPLTLGSDASGSAPTPKHDELQTDTSSRFGIGTSSADDRTPTGPLTLGSDASGSTPTPKHDDPQTDTSSRFGIGTSSADVRDSADHVHQRYELLAPCYE